MLIGIILSSALSFPTLSHSLLPSTVCIYPPRLSCVSIHLFQCYPPRSATSQPPFLFPIFLCQCVSENVCACFSLYTRFFRIFVLGIHSAVVVSIVNFTLKRFSSSILNGFRTAKYFGGFLRVKCTPNWSFNYTSLP